jgi:hypothetical protein
MIEENSNNPPRILPTQEALDRKKDTVKVEDVGLNGVVQGSFMSVREAENKLKTRNGSVAL